MDKLSSDILYMNIANILALQSYATRAKVGALLVKDHNIISFGWNGTPTKCKTNICEDNNNCTHPFVLHAEENVLAKIAKSTISANGSTIYITTSPCYNCSKLLLQGGIVRIVFKDFYRDISPLNFLLDFNIIIDQLSGIDNNYQILPYQYTEHNC